MESYLSSFGASPTPAETESHEVYKRSSSSRKVRKMKKVSTTTTETPIEAKIPTKPLVVKDNGRNFTVSPRHIVKFELDDAKYNEEYEKFRQSRKHRVKRSLESGSETSSTDTKAEELITTKDNFRQPRELFKFSYEDAVTKASLTEAKEEKAMQESEKKNKREVSDSSSADTKNIFVSNPMRGYRSTKQVSYNDIPKKLQKMIDSALHDAVAKGVAGEGDYLKFFYGDKIIKVPVSMSKNVAAKPKETPKYGKNVVVAHNPEEPKPATAQLLTTKNAYYPLINSAIQYGKPKFLPTIPPTTEKPESYTTFEAPIVVGKVPENNYGPYKKSVYLYTDNSQYPKNSMSSPGPVLFEDSVPTTPSSVDSSQQYNYKTYISHPPTKASIIKDSIPITENVNESFDYIPSEPAQSYSPISPPTSYVEYAGNHADYHDYSKNYEFG